jgi:hypothetical protein
MVVVVEPTGTAFKKKRKMRKKNDFYGELGSAAFPNRGGDS